jgi:hypothetical protein
VATPALSPDQPPIVATHAAYQIICPPSSFTVVSCESPQTQTLYPSPKISPQNPSPLGLTARPTPTNGPSLNERRPGAQDDRAGDAHRSGDCSPRSNRSVAHIGVEAATDARRIPCSFGQRAAHPRLHRNRIERDSEIQPRRIGEGLNLHLRGNGVRLPPPSLENVPKRSSIARAKRVTLKDLMALEDPDPVPKRGHPALTVHRDPVTASCARAPARQRAAHSDWAARALRRARSRDRNRSRARRGAPVPSGRRRSVGDLIGAREDCFA